jgi:ribosomal protein S6
MKNYEILLIINPQFSDEEVPSVLEGVFEIIKRNSGEIKEHKILGRNKLAYPIKRAKFGIYVLTQMEIDPLQMEKLGKEITMMPEILRLDVSNEVSKGDFSFKPFGTKELNETEVSGMPAREENVHPEHKASDGNAESAVENFDAAQPVAAVEVPEKLVEEPEVAPAIAEDAEKKAKDSKASLDELDKKLDEILKEEII